MLHAAALKVAAVLIPVRQLATQEHVIHAIVVVIVVLCATGLRGAGALDNGTASIVFGTAIGYAAGRSGSGARAPIRETDTDPEPLAAKLGARAPS